MNSVIINGYKLEKIDMLLVPHSPETVSTLLYPKHRVSLEIDNDKKKLVMKMPVFLVLELYRRNILSEKPKKKAIIQIDNKKMGVYNIIAFYYPQWESENIIIEFEKIKG